MNWWPSIGEPPNPPPRPRRHSQGKAMSQTSISLKLGEDASKAVVDAADKTDIGSASIRVVIKRTMSKLQAVDLLWR